MNTKATDNTQDIDDILDMVIDDLEDLPGFEPFPAGEHKVLIQWKNKKVNDAPAFELSLVAIETVELANSSDTPLEPGAETSVLFMMGNEIARGKFKAVIKALAVATGTAAVRETVEASNGMEVNVITKTRSKDDRVFTELVKVIC